MSSDAEDRGVGKGVSHWRMHLSISKTDRLLWRCGRRLISPNRLGRCPIVGVHCVSGTLGNCALAARKFPVRGNFDLEGRRLVL